MILKKIFNKLCDFIKDNYRLILLHYVLPCFFADLVVCVFIFICFKFQVLNTVLVLLSSIIYYFSFNLLATFIQFKTFKGYFKIFYTPYDDRDFKFIRLNSQTEDNKIEYYSHVYSSLSAFLCLTASISYLINFVPHITYIIVLFLIRVIIFMLCKIPKKLFKIVTPALIIIAVVLYILIILVINDINNKQTFLSMALLFWFSSRMIPTFFDNLTIQNDYLNNKVTQKSIEYKASTFLITVFTYTIIFMLNIATLILSEEFKLNNNLEFLVIAKIYVLFFLLGLYISLILIGLCFLIFKKCKSLYSESDFNPNEEIAISNPETKKSSTIIGFNGLSIIICSSFLVLTGYIFNGNQQVSLDIIKSFFPVFITKLLEGLPHFYNFIYLGANKHIVPTLKFDYLKKMLEVNSGVVTFVLLIASYLKIYIQNILVQVLIVTVIHIFTYFIFQGFSRNKCKNKLNRD